MIVYLDSAELVLLDRLARLEPTQFEDFVGKWHEAGCELGLSFHHAQEIAQLSRPDSIQGRIDLLKSFPIIRFAGFGSLRAMELEIDTQITAAVDGIEPDFSWIRAQFFPIGDVDRFAHIVAEVERSAKVLHGLLTDVSHASTFMRRGKAELRARMEEAGLKWHDAAGGDVDWDSALEAYLASHQQSGAAGDDLEFLKRLLDTQIPFFKAEGSFRGGIQAMYGLKGIPIVDHVAIENFEEVAGYFTIARSRATELAGLCGLDPMVLQAFVPNLSPFEAPGMCLKLAVERGRRQATPAEKASDYIDEEHLPFMAYSDVAFVDKRTHHYANSLVGFGIGALRKESVAHLHKGGTLERVMQVILRR